MIMPPHVAAGVFFEPQRFAFDHVFEADLAGDFRQNRNAVRVPFAKDLAGLDRLVLVDAENGAVGNVVFFQLAAFVVEQRDFAVPREDDVLAFLVGARTACA